MESVVTSARGLKQLNKKITKIGAIILILLVLACIVSCVIYDIPMHSAIFMAIVFTCVFGLIYKFSWLELQEMMFSGIRDSLFLLLLMPLIGVVIGQFIIGGIVPSMIYYGVKFLNPKTFFIFAPIFTALVAMSIGTSWGTASTIGLAMISIGSAMGINKEVLAATIVGSLFCGEILSPLAGSTNLTASLMKVSYKKYVKKIRVPVLIAFMLSIIYNIWYNSGSNIMATSGSISQVLTAIKSQYFVSFALLLIPLAVIFLSWRGMKIIPVLAIGAGLSMLSAVFLQAVPLKTVLTTIYSGPPTVDSHIIINALVQNGGIMKMMSISTLLLMSLGLAGLLEKLGVLETVMSSAMPFLVNNPVTLLLFTLFAGFFLSLIAGSQTLAMMLLIKLVYNSYEKSNVDKSWGSVMVMASAGVIPPRIPWNINGLFLTSVLGVSTVSYFKHSIFSLLLPVVVVIYFLALQLKKRKVI